ncbi:sensor histidine kinase [Kineosporia babensis]|uniref:Sensor histidine kinase n=1 Tax=Kineosporia babensis TaxID=499548 RepID=A0A9X1SVP0_9ACTN|nr:sensor histidine kinase [Kineosporia babensis]MCD5313075.1 sensor histidine kinase [Kineosporia babensis]
MNSVHVWNRFEQVWAVGFWILLALITVGLVISTEVPAANRVTGLACAVVIMVAFAGLRPSSYEPGAKEKTYLCVAIAATGVAAAAAPSLTLLLSVIFAQVWLYSRTHREALGFCALTGFACTVGLLTSSGWTWEVTRITAPAMLVSTAFSAGLGLWISRIIEQSAERADLIGELESTRAELGQAYHTQGVQAERERLAQEIHDTLAQGYTSIIMLTQIARAGLEAAGPLDPAKLEERLAMIEEVARENLGEARALVAAFAPVGLDGATLADAVRRLTGRFGAETQIAAQVSVQGELTGLTRDREVVLLRSAQEALANVRRHAAARSVTVQLAGAEEQVRIEICDDGKGFDVWAKDQPLGFGLTGMRDRAQACGGELVLISSPGSGTRVSVRVPRTPAEAGR